MKWIFGYGSLIWRPAIPFAKKKKALVSGWSRRFWQLSPDHRGTIDSPGRVVTLAQDPLSECVGVAFGVLDKDWDDVKANLDYREKNGYERHFVEAVFDNNVTVSALTYIAGPENPSYSPFGLAGREIVGQVLEAAGPSGTNLDYLTSLNRSLLDIGIDDPEVRTLMEAVLKLKSQI